MKYLLASVLIFLVVQSSASLIPVEATLINAKDTLSNSRLSSPDQASIQSAIHTVTFTTSINVTTPIIEVRIPAKSQSAQSNDGLPDAGSASVAGQSGFDLGHLDSSDVTCYGGGVTWMTPIVVSSETTGDFYHLIKCTTVSGNALGTNQTVIITIGNVHRLINPAPVTGHVNGTADIYKIAVNEYDNGGNLVDRTIVNTAPVDGVYVSALVPESLTFTITGATGDFCGKTSTAKTTDTTVPFGKVLAGTYNASQLLTVSTNGASGYTVSVNEDRPLSINLANNVTIPDTTCPENSCSNNDGTINPADWTKTGDSGFGFSLSGPDALFQYGDNGRKFNSAPFAKTQANIMEHKSPIGESSVYMCYQLAVSPFQQTGIYTNTLTYVATAKF